MHYCIYISYFQANEPREPYLPFGMRQLQAHNKNDKMPSLFFKPEVDEKHLQMKSIIIDMTHFDCDQRLSIEHAKERIKQVSYSDYFFFHRKSERILLCCAFKFSRYTNVFSDMNMVAK